MIGWLLKRALRKFEARHDYDTAYMRELVDLSEFGALKLALVSPFTGERFGLPAAPYHAARIVAARAADCGSCLKLAIGMGRDAGVPLAAIRALLTSDNPPADMALAGHYARAVLDNAPELTDIIPACEARWGRTGVAGLAAAVVSGSLYPTLKRGLGHGNRCEPVLAWLEAEARTDESAGPEVALGR